MMPVRHLNGVLLRIQLQPRTKGSIVSLETRECSEIDWILMTSERRRSVLLALCSDSFNPLAALLLRA